MGKLIYKIWNEKTKEVVDSIVARPNSKEKKAFVDKFHDEYQAINNFNCPNDELNVYQLVEVDGNYSCPIDCNYYHIRKTDLEKYKWEKVSPELCGVFFRQLIDMPYYVMSGNVYAPKEAIEKVTNVLKTEYKPLVIKNTDFPYWFDVEGKLLPSEESNWFLFLYQTYNYVSRASLENYKEKSSTKKAKD